jgi:hypothetical protein
MKTLSRLLCVVALGAAGFSVQATEPPARGKVLVLDNERTVEGDVERVGDVYHVRRTLGETVIPGERVLRLCASLEEALTFLRSRANLKDPDEHLRLAGWCHQHGLRAEALAEVQAAVRLRPGHEETRRLLDHLQQAAQASSPSGKPTLPNPAPAPSLAVDLTEEALGQFASRVQPILMNTCASCHVAGKGGSFQLTRAYDSTVLNRKTTEQNLAAVLAQIDFGQPQASRLLTKALSDHARTGQAPLKGRQAAAYRTLEDWVRLTLANNPHLGGDRTSPPPSLPKATNEEKTTVLPMPPKSEPARSESTEKAIFAEKTVGPGPADPFDPAVFNRQMHPQRTETPAPKK